MVKNLFSQKRLHIVYRVIITTMTVVFVNVADR